MICFYSFAPQAVLFSRGSSAGHHCYSFCLLPGCFLFLCVTLASDRGAPALIPRAGFGGFPLTFATMIRCISLYYDLSLIAMEINCHVLGVKDPKMGMF